MGTNEIDFYPETSAEEYAVLVGKVKAVMSYLEYRDSRGDDVTPDEILAMLGSECENENKGSKQCTYHR